jgi:pimeloyl-ACP methyl ester carboxylesterase
LVVAALFAGCATSSRLAPTPAPLVAAQRSLKTARGKIDSFEDKAVAYLDAARSAALVLAATPNEPNAVRIYNEAAAGAADLLYKGRREKTLDSPIRISSNGSSYEVRVARGRSDGIWDPTIFTKLKPASEINERHARVHAGRGGVGGTLVGIRHEAAPGGRREKFEPAVGFVAPVTATVDFQTLAGTTIATVSLRDPAEQESFRLGTRTLPLAADFTAALSYYPLRNELWTGFLSMIQVEKHLGNSGLYMLQPYDPDRIPVIFVHGLMSTPQMWLNVINEVEADPKLMGKFQFWAFQYPSGNPVSYSALRMREELAAAQRMYGLNQGVVLVGHSMGGLVSRMQAITTGRKFWDANFGNRANEFYAKIPDDSVLKRGFIYEANPRVKRLVFVCVPHRGSEMALGWIGRLGTSLISLPVTFVKSVETAVGGSLETITGQKGTRMPTSIQSLSPKNKTLIAMDGLPIRAPHHSIIGDRGRGDTPKSSDGVVPYWSSHLPTAESELIVPGPHGSYALQQTIDELRRVLRLHLQKPSNN